MSAAAPPSDTPDGSEPEAALDDARDLASLLLPVPDHTRELFERTQELNEALDELRKQQTRLVEAEKQAALAGLVAGMAHELNTPVGNALTAATALQDAADGIVDRFEHGALTRSELRHFLSLTKDAVPIILSSLRRSIHLIDSFKRLAVGETDAMRRRFDLREQVEGVLIAFTPRARQEGHRLTAACPDGILMEGYPDVLAQVLAGLVANALDHGLDPDTPGTVAVLAREEGDTVELRCVDDGRGIEPAHLDRIFDPFFTTGRGRGASGLGLNIVHNAVTRVLGGTILCDSTPGLGTTVILRLPREAPILGP